MATQPAKEGAGPGETEIRWLGHAMFLITDALGIRTLTDPYGEIGYPLPASPMEVDLVTVSHEHGDHNNVGLARPTARVVRGLTKDGWAAVKEDMGETAVTAIPSYHDEKGGSQRGRNAIFIIDASGARIVHCGDLGHPLPEETVRRLGKVDVLLLPVGGVYTLDAKAAAQVVEQVQPQVTVPMHYKLPGLVYPLSDVEPFLRTQRKETVTRASLRIPAGGPVSQQGTVVLTKR